MIKSNFGSKLVIKSEFTKNYPYFSTNRTKT